MNTQLQNVFTKERLISIMKSRLRTQDRMSGDKIWLPMDVLAKVYNPNKGNKTTRFTEWLKEIAKSIYINYLDDNQVKSIKLNKIDSICFNDNTKDVSVFIKDIGYTVLTPTGILNKKNNNESKFY